MIDASTQREDDVHQQAEVTSAAATSLSSADMAVADPYAPAAPPDETAAPPGEAETIIVPPASEAELSSSAPEATPVAGDIAAEAAPPLAGESDSVATSESLVEPAPIAEIAPAAEAELPLADSISNELPVRPAPRLPLGDKVVEDAPSEAAELVPDGDEDAPQLARRGRIELLPNEEIIYHLSALYLTNKRVLLYAPTVLRAAFLRDVDAMGMATERLSGGMFVLGLAMMVVAALTGGLIYFDANQELSLDSPLKGALTGVRNFLPLPLEWVVVGIALLGLFFIISYFFYVSKSLFVSVHGRPLITVSIGGYRPRNLDDIDNFINALAGAKDALDNGGEEISLVNASQ